MPSTPVAARSRCSLSWLLDRSKHARIKRRDHDDLPNNAARVAHISTAHPSCDNRIFHKKKGSPALADDGFDTWLIVSQSQSGSVDGINVHGIPRHSAGGAG